MNGKIDKNGNLHIERGKLGYVPCECINSDDVCHTNCGKMCSHHCSHFEEPTLEKNSVFTDGVWVDTGETYTALTLCKHTLTFDSFTDERGVTK